MTKQSQGTVLYVDDDAANRNTFALVFREAGFEVKEAATGGEALRLAEEKPDLVILAVGLPDINGFEVCRRLKAHPATTAIPVMHLSAVYVTPEDRTHALEMGADGYLTKPIDVRTLIPDLQTALKRHEMRNTLPAGTIVTTAEVKAVMGDIKAEVAARITQAITQTAPVAEITPVAEPSQGDLRATQEAKVETAVAIAQTSTVKSTNEEQVKHEQG